LIAEATVTFDSVEYQIPYYKYLGTDNVEKLSVPFKDFYIKKNGTNTVDLSRESAAKLYEASQSLTLISYRKSQYVEGIDTDSRQALESYKTEVLERDDDGTWAKRIGLIGTFGGLAIAVGAAAVCTATVVCAIVIIGALITGGTGVGGYVSATYSNAEVFDKSARTIIIVESYQNNFEVFRETSEFSSLLGIGFELENEIAVNYSELENSIDSIELAFAKLLGAHYGLTQLPHIPEVDLVASSLWAASNVVASPLKLDVVNAGVNSLAFAVGYVLDRQAEGMEVTDEMFLSKMEDSFTTANVKAPDFFHENRLAIYSLNLLQFQASIEPKETVDRAISGAITTSQGSQLRFRFDNYPVGKTLKVQNNTQTWTYTIPDSGQVFPVINMGSDNTGIDYQVTDSDGLVIINTQTFDTVLIENTVTGVQATSLNDGVRITYNSGLPSGYDGVIICQGLSEPSSNFNGDTALPNVNDGCGTDSIVVMAAHDTSSNYLNLNQGEIYYYSVQPYNLVPATTDPDNAAYYEMATPIQVAARPNISGTLKGTPQNHQIPDGEFTSAIVWEASGFNPYRISGTLNIPANDEFTWFDDAANNTLIIEPKTSVHMLSQSSKLIVYGSMYADAPSNGTDPIIITSDNSNPAAGDWGSIQFIEGSSGTLNSLKVEYGGDGSAGVYLDGNATFSQLSMRHIKGNGVWFRKSTQGKVFNSHITNVSKYALYATSTGAEVPTNKYTAQLNYLEGTNGETSLGHNGIGAPPTVSGNQSSDYSKTINALHISNITITGDVTWSISDRVVDGTVTIAQGAKLTIFQGVDVYMKDRGSRLIVKGELKVLGHPSNQVYFTSINDTPAAGDWGYIHFAEGSTGTLNNVVIEYGGDDNYTSTGTNSLGKESAYSGFVSASLVIDSSPVLDNITIKNAADVTTSASYRNPVAGGIWLRGAAAPAITNSTIENAESYGFYAPSTTGDFSLTNSQLQNNAYAAYVSGTGNFVFSNNQVEDNGDNDALRVQGSIAHDTIFDQDIKLIGQVVINAGVKLTIKPGVTIYGADRASRLIVKGDLQAVGRAGELITFTSDNATPAAGDWGYIHFAPGSTGSLQYVTVEYGGDDNCASSGSNSFGVSCRAGLASTSLMIESSPTLNHVLVKSSADITHNYSYNSQAVGLWIRGEGAPSIQNSVIDGAEYYGFYANGTGNYNFSNNTIQNSSYGAYAAGSGAFSFVGNQILANGQAGSWVASALATVASNTIDGNGDNDALRVQGTITKDTLFAEDIKLVGQVTIAPGVTVTLSPGITIYGADRSSRLLVKGALIANAPDEANRILFTSDNETPAAGDWGYIHFTEGSTGSLQYVTVEYGGDDNCTSSGSNSFGVSCRAGLASTSLMIESSPTLNHVLVKGSADITHNYSYNSQAVGLWIRGEGAPSIQNSVIDGAEYYGIYSSATKSVSLNALTIIDTKTNLGAYATNGFLNLTQTDWGTNTGPYHLTENPEGLGATVSGNVIFKWWKGEDTDGDGLPDYWENLYGSNPSVATNTSSDNDGDGLTLLQEFQLGTDFNSVDTDDDGLSDAWESEHGMQATVASDASQDFDGDGLTNLEEFTLGTDINLADTDNDGFADNLDELPLIAGEHLDFDKDGVGDFADNDDDDDGIPDDFEFSHGLNSKDASDALLDMDGDGSSNLDEFLASTDLNNASSNATVHQHIIPLQANIMVRAGNEFYSYLNYTTTDANTALPGLQGNRIKNGLTQIP
jgi:hypothetical protein